MNLQFKYINSDEERDFHYSSKFNIAIEQIKHGDPQTERMYRALELFYQSFAGARTIEIRRISDSIACLDFVEAYGALTPSDKDKRNTCDWRRACKLAEKAAFLVVAGYRTTIFINFAD
ncbi:hypothetical protein BK660_23210 [Pseudomonas brassicacearum]|uniref:Uncharacterized protein n=1 Tax=Pseudomonas brassicacearum TaxID=930166 RepID=A0A423HWH3_9PSED|nr:hypothetical protein [Pseudomonas brassicacearum]RON17564.1 hypothetical protein BK660_23210 [Pseudomonas brassicacearum]